ncbi:hypothetical protein HD806DRAFT_496229 [Xylariaceae sp. AK1471]|nr:hypothetical protein HD806DRAFT_496229 [Xylariaceae sp. AK1471]
MYFIQCYRFASQASYAEMRLCFEYVLSRTIACLIPVIYLGAKLLEEFKLAVLIIYMVYPSTRPFWGV